MDNPILQGVDPTTQPSFSLRNRLARALWQAVWLLLFRPSLRPMHGWRCLLLRLFGARLGQHFHVHSSVQVWAPWQLVAEDFVGIGERAILYNMAPLKLGQRCVISQGAHLCGGTHDYNTTHFQLLAKPIAIGAHAWVCTEAFVGPGVEVPEGAVVGARAVLTRSPAQAWTVYAGNPALPVAERQQHGR
jgi:putative colanic acid biosynthesis acetyltransferase WcaF